MQISRRKLSTARVIFMGKLLSLALMTLACALLQSCSGASNPNYTSTSVNPAPGISLVSISITPATSLISLAESRQLFATGTYSDGSQIDISSQVTWGVSSSSSTINFVVVNPGGVATGRAIGASVVTATLGPVVGALQLTVDTNGYTSGTTAILSVPYKTTIVDAAYLPQSQALTQGAYAVQEVNLDADQFSDVLPVPNALLASIPMPAGYVPNVTVANQSKFLVAVISYSSPAVQIIDASNIPSDVASNLIIATFTAPVSQSVTLNGIKCMICAAAVNPQTGNLLLSTAQGFYTMDMVAGTFTPIPFTPTPAPAANFSLNTTATNPYILSAIPGTSQLQILNLTTNAVTTLNSGLTTPGATAIDLVTDYGTIVDAQTNSQSLVNLASAQSPVFTPIPDLGTCGTPVFLNMAAMAVSATVTPSDAIHTLFTSQTSGSCAGFQTWPSSTSTALNAADITTYWYGPMPATPDGKPFVNGSDPNAIATFNDVYKNSNYGLLVDANQQWIARINLGFPLSISETPVSLPSGLPVPPDYLCSGITACPNTVVFLPTPNTAITVSLNNINFGSVAVGTQTAPIALTLANIGAIDVFPVIAIQGTNAGDFSLISSCTDTLLSHTNCGLNVLFTPSATGTRSATLSITTGGEGSQTVALSGTGT